MHVFLFGALAGSMWRQQSDNITGKNFFPLSRCSRGFKSLVFAGDNCSAIQEPPRPPLCTPHFLFPSHSIHLLFASINTSTSLCLSLLLGSFHQSHTVQTGLWWEEEMQVNVALLLFHLVLFRQNPTDSRLVLLFHSRLIRTQGEGQWKHKHDPIRGWNHRVQYTACSTCVSLNTDTTYITLLRGKIHFSPLSVKQFFHQDCTLAKNTHVATFPRATISTCDQDQCIFPPKSFSES